MHKNSHRIWLWLMMGVISLSAAAQQRPGTQTPPTTNTGAPPQTPPVVPARPGPKPYKDVITDKAITKKGMFWVHKIEDKWFFELNDSLLGRDFLVVNRISKLLSIPVPVSAGFAGDEINENVVRFEKGPNNKVFLRNISFSVYAKDSTKPMYKSVQNSNVQPIAAAFDIKALAKDSNGVVLELTDYINSDNDILYFASFFKTALRIGGMQSDKSYIVDIRSYPINTEIRTVKTYSQNVTAFTYSRLAACWSNWQCDFRIEQFSCIASKVYRCAHAIMMTGLLISLQSLLILMPIHRV